MLVSDTGPRDAKIMLIDEAPETNQAGIMLKKLLAHSGINYHQCFVTSVVNVSPPSNNFSHFYEDKRRKVPTIRLEEYWTTLANKVKALRPNVIIPLGGEALRALTNERKISDWRGTVMLFDNIKVIPTYRPYAVIRKYDFHPIVEMDLAKAFRESKFPEWNEPNVSITIKPTLHQAVHFIEECRPAFEAVSFDIETIGKHVRSIAFARKGYIPVAISIPFITLNQSSIMSIDKNIINIDSIITPDIGENNPTSYWSAANEVIILDCIAKLFNDKRIEKIGQNSISFDAPLIYNEFGLEIVNHGFDTMHAWHVLYPEFPKSLNFLCSALTNYPNYWSNHDPGIDESEWYYNAMDSIVTLDVAAKIKEELENAVI